MRVVGLGVCMYGFMDSAISSSPVFASQEVFCRHFRFHQAEIHIFTNFVFEWLMVKLIHKYLGGGLFASAMCLACKCVCVCIYLSISLSLSLSLYLYISLYLYTHIHLYLRLDILHFMSTVCADNFCPIDRIIWQCFESEFAIHKSFRHFLSLSLFSPPCFSQTANPASSSVSLSYSSATLWIKTTGAIGGRKTNSARFFFF